MGLEKKFAGRGFSCAIYICFGYRRRRLRRMSCPFTQARRFLLINCAYGQATAACHVVAPALLPAGAAERHIAAADHPASFAPDRAPTGVRRTLLAGAAGPSETRPNRAAAWPPGLPR